MYKADCSSETYVNLDRLFLKTKSSSYSGRLSSSLSVEDSSSLQHTKTQTIDDVPINFPNSNIPTVTVVAKEAGGAVSVVSTVFGSVGSIGQVSRIAILNIRCTYFDNSSLSSALDWTNNPTQMSIPTGALSNIDGALLGNWLIIAGSGIGYLAASYKFGKDLLRSPGSFNYVNLFFASPLAFIATTMLRFGGTTEKVMAGLSLSLQFSSLGAISYVLLQKFDPALTLIKSEYENNLKGYIKYLVNGEYRWSAQSDYKKQYGALFRDYKYSGFIVAELAMNTGVGVLTSFQTYNQYSACDATLYVTYALYLAYTGSLILLRPYLSTLDNAYYISISVLQLSVLTINVAQSIRPELQDNQDLNNAKQCIVDSLYYIALARSIFDAIKNAKNLYGYVSKLWSGEHKFSVGADLEMSLLNIFRDEEHGVSSSTESSEGIVAQIQRNISPDARVVDPFVNPVDYRPDLVRIFSQMDLEDL